MTSLTDYLQRYSSGDKAAGEVAFLRAFPRLCRIAAAFLRGRKDRNVFSPPELVNVVWLRDFCKGGWPVNSSEHFFAMAGRSMRRAMVNEARKDQARKRQRLDVQIDDIAAADHRQLGVASHEQVIQLNQLMEQLAEQDPKTAAVVDMHHIHGLSFDDVSKLIGLNARQVRYRWETGRSWLLEHLKP